MKKDIEWIKDKLFEIAWVVNETQYLIELEDVYEVIDQLDEPEVLSQEWISEHMYYVEDRDSSMIYVSDLQNLLVPKQEELEVKIQELIETYKQEEDAYGELENGWISGFIKDLKNLVEEEPLYYALIKGHELMADENGWICKYWKFDTYEGNLFPSNQLSRYDRVLTKMSKEEWNKLGINDTNADFVEVEVAE